MDLKTQLLLIFISFLFGVFYLLLFFKYKKNVIKNNIYQRFFSDFVFNFLFFLLFAIILYFLNNLTLHIYILLYFFLGVYMCYLYVNKD